MMGPINWLVDNIMLPFLTFSYHHVFPNYGVAIILLTVVIKVLFWPLNTKQFKAMQKQKLIQPEMKKIQEKHKKEPEKLNQEILKLWKEHDANPLTGCWPILIQIPIFFALFYTMKSSSFMSMIAAQGANPGLFSFWLTNLGKSDPLFILPIIIGLTMFWSQKLSITDPQQAKIFMFMPVVIVIFSIKMPAGLLLYWAVSQILSLAQQIYVMRDNGDMKSLTNSGQ